MRLTAAAAIHRGLFNTRANWELMLVLWLQSLVISVIFVLGLVPPLVVLGLGDLPTIAPTGEGWAELLRDVVGQIRGDFFGLLGSLIGAAVVTFLIWYVAFVVYCFFQAGVLAVLISGDRQCVSGAPADWRPFRTFSMRGIFGWGRRYLWRYFWLFNLFLVFHLVWILLLLCLVWIATFGYQQWGGPAAAGIACGGALPLGFGVLVLALCLSLAQVDLAREGGSVQAATRRSLEVLGSRPGAVALILLLTILAGMTLGLVFTLFPVLLRPIAGGALAAQVAVQTASTLVQWLVGSGLSVVFFASLAALVQDRQAA